MSGDSLPDLNFCTPHRGTAKQGTLSFEVLFSDLPHYAKEVSYWGIFSGSRLPSHLRFLKSAVARASPSGGEESNLGAQ